MSKNIPRHTLNKIHLKDDDSEMKIRFFLEIKDRLNHGVKRDDAPYILIGLMAAILLPWISLPIVSLLLVSWFTTELCYYEEQQESCFSI